MSGDRQTDRQIDRQIDRQTGRQTDRQTDTHGGQLFRVLGLASPPLSVRLLHNAAMQPAPQKKKITL